MRRSGGPTGRGPLAPLDGMPGVRAALARAGVVALVRTAGIVLLAAGLATAIARIVDGAPPLVPLLLAGAGVVVRAVAGAVGEMLAARDARRAEDALRAAVTDRFAVSPAAVAAAGGPGPAAVLLTTRLFDLGPSLAGYLPALAQTLVVPPVLLVVLGWTDPLSAVLVAVTLPLVPVFMVLVGKYTADRTSAAARTLDRIAGYVTELVRGLPVLTGLGRAAEQTAALAGLGERYRRTTTATLRLAFLSALVLELIATLAVALVAVTVGLRLLEGHLTLAVGLTAILLAPEAFAPLRALGAAFHANADAALAAAQARAVLAAPVPAATEAGSGPVVLTDLTVGYPERSTPALPPTSLLIRSGEVLALAGPSGCGKSTLLAALAGAVPLDAVVGGTLAGVPARAAVALQHPRTTADTVTAELLVHAGSAATSTGRAVVAAALARVGASDLADRRCLSLSPGELQRVALARALVRVELGAELLLLDEPTAHLDARSAARVAAVIDELRGRITVVLVTHDTRLLRLADRVVTLDGRSPSAEPTTGAAPAAGAGSPDHEIAALPVVPGPFVSARPPAGLAWPRRALVRAVAAGTLTSLAGVALTALSGWLVVRAAELPPVLTLLTVIVGVRACGLGRAVLRWWERLTVHDAALRLAADTRVRVWTALARQGITAERAPGAALGRVVGDIALLQDLSVRVLTPPLVAAITVLVSVGVLAVVSPSVAGAVLLLVLLGVGVVALLHRRVDAGAARDEATLRVAALRECTTVLDGAVDLRVHGMTGAALGRVRTVVDRQGAAARVGVRAGAWSAGVVSGVTGAAAVAAAFLAWAGGLTGPVVALLALTPLALAEPLTGLVAARQRRGAWVDVRSRVDGVLAAPVAPDPALPVAAPHPVTALAAADLVAGWPGGPDVLQHIDFTAARDGWLVVRGPSGSGKSTLLAVLLAGLRPRDGQYELAGTGVAATAVRSADVLGDDIRAAMAWLPQESHVFASSLRANLAVARPRGEIDDDRMHTALAAVGLTALVATMPAGLDTPVGSGGAALSGGERRRLAAARALLADRGVVLLDEPTAHLDPPTARALIRDLRTALAGRVVVCVTHDDDVAAPGDHELRLDRALVPA
ncbi:thiol reductant ABC exporter subunit CydC [Nakamurella flavida]|uniref:Thiol reductant ABC exporter subunit CydC n=1 Tax=Nakamurella flavida TaxID=363630 RepID=A0A939C0F2_9ACTN|nr:thiol reductant ABC exporter subunit CydC [Nakamurella flavida]MBM9476653.1 thiol reductant ABC exporter subunit CydC [Nakamurella flavida]MDP9778909.1 ATP-binding cassette subfamily C protein CydCD [Nakamurella flavida]